MQIPKIALFLGIQQVLRALLKSEITNLPKAVYHLRYLHCPLCFNYDYLLKLLMVKILFIYISITV